MSLRTGVLWVATSLAILASQAVTAGDECRNAACRADERIQVCLLPPPVEVADSRGVSHARTSPRTVSVQLGVADRLVESGAAMPGPCP
jgi:hypothetical protein